MIFDTGSDLTAFPCDLCKEGHCGKHNNPSFNQKDTNTIFDLKCDATFGNWKCKACDHDNQCKFERLYTESVGNDGLYGPIFIDDITVGDGDDILAGPSGFEESEAYKKTETEVRRRYI